MTQIGYIPPQAIEVEKSLLGLILISGKDIDLELFKPEIFYNHAHQIIAGAISEMVSENRNIDILTVSEKLKNDGKFEEMGGKAYLTKIVKSMDASGDATSYQKILFEKYLLRQLIRISSEVSRRAYQSEDPFDLVAELQTLTASLLGFSSESIQTIRDGIISLKKIIDRNLSGSTELTGLPSGLVELDRFTNGFQKSDLIIVGGETSQGKTALGLKVALSAAQFKHKVVIYSFEMSAMQLAARFTAMETGFSAKSMQFKRLQDYELAQVNEGFGKIEGLPIYIDNISDSSFDYLERSIRIMVQKNRMEMVIIDYLQLIRHKIKSGNKAEATAEIANRLKGLAKVLNVPIILVSQLARNKDKPKPSIARLKGSGAIENAADLILLIWRPEFYGMQNFECRGDNYPAAGLAHLIVGKGRNTGITEMVLSFRGETTLFSDYEEKTFTNNYTPY